MDREPIKIVTAADNIQAEMIIAALKNNGIPSYKRDVGSSGLMKLYTGSTRYGEEIFVDPASVSAAKEVLLEMGIEPAQ